MYQKNFPKFLVFGIAIIATASVACAGESRDSTRSQETPLIIDTTAPPGHLTGEQKRQWEQRQQEIWSHADEHFNHIQSGDLFFRKERYQEALHEYTQAAERAAINSELLQAKEHVAIAFESLGNFEEALSAVEFLIQQTLNERVKQDDLHWKQALEAASQGQYVIALQYYKDRFATAKDWEKKSLFLEQRLRLMEDRARVAGPNQ